MISSKSIRFQLVISTAVAASLALSIRAGADPLPVPTAPDPNITTNGNTQTVTLTGARSVKNWNSFDIDQGFTVDFTGPTNSAVLNRVVTADVSNINGSLLSDPTIEVFLINPNGIIFGSTAVVDVGSFVASTLGITDNDFLLGDITPTELTFFSPTSTSAGVTVDSGAQITTESGNLALIGGLIDVEPGGVVDSAGDAALIAANQVTIPADPGSPLIYSFTVQSPTPAPNGITVGGTVTGQNVSLFQESEASAVNTLLSVTASAQITATKVAGGDIELTLAARTDGVIVDSPGRIENHGALTASGDIQFDGGAQFFTSGGVVTSTVPHAPRSVENDGTVNAVGDVLMQARRNVTNTGTINADNVTLEAFGSASASASGVTVLNSGTITAKGDVHLFASAAGSSSIILFAAPGSGSLEPFAAPAANVHVTNSGTIDATGDVALEAINGDVTNSGNISGDNVTLSAFAVGTSESSAPNIFVDNSGTINAKGNVRLSASASFSDSYLAAATGQAPNIEVTNTGKITAGGDVDLIAQYQFTGLATVGDAATLPFVQVTNDGTINAQGSAHLFAEGGEITNSGVIDVGGVARLQAGGNIDNSGSISATGDTSLIAGNDILDSSGTFAGSIGGADVALSADGDITVGSVTARDDIAIRAGGIVTTRSLTSGTTVNGAGPIDVNGVADQLLTGVNLAGHDVDIDGTAIFAGVINALGTGSDIRLRKPVKAAVDDLDFAAGGDITIDGDASGVDVAMDAGGTITAGDISARDDIALRAGNTLDVGILQSGVTIDGQGPVDQVGSADALLGQTLVGHDLFVQGGTVSLAEAIANGTNSDLTVIATTGDLDIVDGEAGGTITLTKQGTTGILTADTLLAGTGATLTSDTDIEANTVETTTGDLTFKAGGDVTVVNPLEADDVAIDAGGTITTAAITARDDIALIAGGTLDVGILTSGVAINGTGPVDTAGAADALLGQTLTGHDIFVQGGTVNLAQAIANGTGSDLTVRATTGDLNIVDGQAGGTITLIKEGATGVLTAQTLLAGTGATLTSSTDILAHDVETLSGDLAFTAGGDVTVDNPLAATDVAIDAGGTINTGDISARDDIALRAGDTLNVGTLTSGVSIGGTGPVDTAGAADALLDENLAGHDIFVQGGSVTLAQATANGAGSDLTVDATSGALNLTNGTAGGAITLTKEGATGALIAGTLSAGTGASLTSSTSINATNVQSSSGDVDFDAIEGVTVGTVTAQAGDVNFLANDLDITNSVTGSAVSITNREGGNDVTVLGDASAPNAFTLTQDEINRIHSPTLTIDSLDQNLLVGNVAFANDVGSTRINLLGTGRVDIVGAIDGSSVTRTLQIGGTLDPADPNDPTTLASIIRIAATSSGGGRIILGDGSLDLRGVKIGVGLDDGFLQPLGLTAGGTPASTSVVQTDWIGNRGSSLYGIPGGYANPIIISAGTITVTYKDYALFQNTAGQGLPSGVNAGVLNIISSGADGNGFEMFGTIDEVAGFGAVFLVNPTTVSMGNSRINGCLILTGGGCGGPPGTTPPIPTLTTNPPDPPAGTDGGDQGSQLGGAGSELAQQDMISSGDDKAFDFDSLVGTNNEGLLGVLGIDDAKAPENCTPDDKRQTCRVQEKPNDQ